MNQMNQDASHPPNSPSRSPASPSLLQHPQRHTYTPPFFIPQMASSTQESFPLQLGSIQPPQVHYSPSLPRPALSPGNVYNLRPAYLSVYPVQANPHGGVMQPQMYGYLSVSSPRVQSQSEGLIHNLHTSLYRTPNQHSTHHYPYVHSVSPESGGLEHHLATAGQSSQQPSQLSNDLSYTRMRYIQSSAPPSYGYSSRSIIQNSPPLYQTTYIPVYGQSYYRESSTHDSASTWWYLPQPSSSPGTSYDSPTVPPQQSGPFERSSSHSTDPPEAEAISPQTQNSLTRPEFGQREVGSLTTASLDVRMSGLSVSSLPTSGLGHRKRSKSASQSAQSARRPFHPNPPVNRSEWVMWVGNVPSDASHDELWNFFNGDACTELPSKDHLSSHVGQANSRVLSEGGVVSVFLIARSNCAFVNFSTEAHLEKAVSFFNGKALRPQDPRCAKLVCRIRRPDDDLKAGVGGQRGIGMHVKWLREKKQRVLPETKIPQHSHPTPKGNYSPSSDFSMGSSPGRSALTSSMSSGSYASTTSSFLTRYFPKRFFILKSLNEVDLNLSVENGVWATQLHNEGILDQAFYTSKDVYLIFSANKSGEFFGYARMSGPILPGERNITWAARSDSISSNSMKARPTQLTRGPVIKEGLEERGISLPTVPILSPGERRMAISPGMLTSEEDAATKSELQVQHPPLRAVIKDAVSHTDPEPAHTKMSFFLTEREHDDLDSQKLCTTVTPHSALVPVFSISNIGTQGEQDSDNRVLGEGASEVTKVSTNSLYQNQESADVTKVSTQKYTWGSPFPIEWIRTDRVSFQRTRHLRNPWNHDREVKVSRDGTELEPSIGEALLAEWEKLRTLSPPLPPLSSDA